MLSVNDRAKELGAWLLKSTSTRSCKTAVRNVSENMIRLSSLSGVRESSRGGDEGLDERRVTPPIHRHDYSA